MTGKEEECLQSFLEKVIQPAVKLANMTQTLPSKYKFFLRLAERDCLKRPILKLRHLSEGKLIDISTGKLLDVDSLVQANEAGEIGEEVMVLVPALYRCEPGQDPLRLVKVTVLVELYSPLGRRPAVIRPSKARYDSSLI